MSDDEGRFVFFEISSFCLFVILNFVCRTNVVTIEYW